jgi:hypothetical protein
MPRVPLAPGQSRHRLRPEKPLGFPRSALQAPRVSLDRFLIEPLHEIDQTYSLLPAPAQLRIRLQSIGFEEFGKSLVGLAHHQLVVSDFFVEKRVFGETLSKLAAFFDRSFELSHRTEELALGAAHSHAPRLNKEGFLHSEVGRVKVGDLIPRPMVQYTGHKCKRQIRQSGWIMRIEVDRPLPERAGGFVILPRSYTNRFGDAIELCCCFDIRCGSGLGKLREVIPRQNPKT